MISLQHLSSGTRLAGVLPATVVEVVATVPHGSDAITLIYRTTDGQIEEIVLYGSDESRLAVVDAAGRPFDADANDFKLAAEAQRIRLAGLYDPMLAVATSDVRPLPHQIRAVYGELLPRTPLRFLLADDPGAGKTIMAGLYIKELILRGDVQRCLVVAPGGLVDQWQDELYLKFGLRFDILDPSLADAPGIDSVFAASPLQIARMDQVARNEVLLEQLDDTEFDLVVIDEAHRMSAHYFGGKLLKSKRFQLGERLNSRTRHLLLMTATPHAGKEEDFQLFLTLLDKDRFEGKYAEGIHSDDTSGLMRRMVKEDLLTFEGRPLFPERVAETVPYELTEAEYELYEEVTSYVRDGMNRAARLDDKRKNTVGFALTVLQRRLASSPEAIYRSLVRRVERLQKSRHELLNPSQVAARDAYLAGDAEILDDLDEYTAEEIEHIEEELVDAATAARTVEELDAELIELSHLVASASRVRASEQDRKWTELRAILEDHALTTDANGSLRKLIIFTEHRDTLDYLERRIGTLLGRPETVKSIHGGVTRLGRRMITEEFTKNPECQILLATDAAGEGLNLQAAHLMVNYDLPWNPNRLEQRFGRIHRIGQAEVCRLWNLVATNTREGAVFERLLLKVEEQRKAYGGKVFDVLGAAFENTPLRTLLMDAIRYGEQPEVRQRMHEVIDHDVADGLKELIEQESLDSSTLAAADVDRLRRDMEEARSRRLQPHYIELAFREAFTRLGGRMSRREKDRYEITNVPAAIRHHDRTTPVATRYERITFTIDAIDGAESRADLVAPGHPLHDAVADLAVRRWGRALESGTVLVSGECTQPRLLVGVLDEVADANGSSVARRFGYAFVGEDGAVEPAGPAPYLDFVAAPGSEAVAQARRLPWLPGAEEKATSWMVGHQLQEWQASVTSQRNAELQKTRDAVKSRLNAEINRLSGEALLAREKEDLGQKVRESADSLVRKADELEARLVQRLESLDRQLRMAAKPPRVIASALVLPLAMVEGDIPPDAPVHAVETKEVERRGVEAVLAAERNLGRSPVEQAFNNPGYDVLSTACDGSTLRIEVKARIEGADDFFITYNEVLTGKNSVPGYRLALVRVSPESSSLDEVRYLDDPFAGTELGGLAATGLRIKWDPTFTSGHAPF